MSLQFRQVVENLNVWCAGSADISFVITFASPTGRARLSGASWLPCVMAIAPFEHRGDRSVRLTV
jgi:hypothetical protein